MQTWTDVPRTEPDHAGTTTLPSCLTGGPLRVLATGTAGGSALTLGTVLVLGLTAPLVAGGSGGARTVQGLAGGVALLGAALGPGLLWLSVVVEAAGQAPAPLAARAALAWAGNLLGAVVTTALVAAAGVLTAGAPRGSRTAAEALLSGTLAASHALSGVQLLVRGLLGGVVLGLGLLAVQRARTDTARVVALLGAGLLLAVTGEHSVTTMVLHPLGLLSGLPQASFTDWVVQLLLVTLGNALGAVAVVGLSRVGLPAASAKLPEPVAVDVPTAPPAVLPSRRRTPASSPRRVSSAGRP